MLKRDVDKWVLVKLENVSKDLSSLKSKVGKLDIDKLAPVSVDLSKLSNVVKNRFGKNTEYDKLVKKVNAI